MNDSRQIYLRTIGDVYLPGRVADAVPVDAPVKLFGARELSQLNKIFSHLRKGGIAVTSGSWDKILGIFDYLEKKKREFATTTRPSSKEERRSPVYRKQSNRWYERHYQMVMSRVMVMADEDRILDVDPPILIPYLFQLLGESTGANDGLPFLVPVSLIQKIQSDMKQTNYISALEADIVVHSNVLQPLSQDTVELFQEGLKKLEQRSNLFQENMEILDMGCGCGVLSLLAAKIFADHHVRITATDILPEAIATTKINVQRFANSTIKTTDSGDLFQPVAGHRYDIIIFNAPWVVSQPKSRADIALCDANQDTIRRFLNECPQHLEQNGRVVLAYSDHSGPAALENLGNMIAGAGLKIEGILKRRVQTRSQQRKWETILVYEIIRLAASCSHLSHQ